MRRIRSGVATFVTFVVAGCTNSSECDCVAPMVVVLGTITGAASSVEVEVRLAGGVCRDQVSTTGIVGRTGAIASGSYQIGLDLPQPGPACVSVTARTLSLPLLTATTRVDATITPMPVAGPQQIRADVAF